MKKVLGIMLFTVMFFCLSGCVGTTTEESAGTVTLEVYNADDVLVSSEVVDFKKDDTLLSLVMSSFGAICQGEHGESDSTCSYAGTYGIYVLGVGSVVSDPTSQYIALYINGEYAMTGIDSTPLADGNVYAFKLETF